MDETKLIALAQQGDRGALAKLLQQHYSFLAKYLLKITLNPHLAEDLTQETMLRAIEKIRLYNGSSAFSSWLMTIATRLYIDGMRRKKRERAWQQEAQAQALRKLKWQADWKGQAWPEVLDVLAGLPEEVRVPIILRHYYHYTYREIGKMLDLREGTVKSRIYNGLNMIRKELDGHETRG